MFKSEQAATRKRSQRKASALAKVPSVVIVAVVAVAAVAVGLFVATRGSGTTPISIATPTITTPPAGEFTWCRVGLGVSVGEIYSLEDTLTTPPFTIRGPQFKVVFEISSATAPPSATLSVTVLTVDGDEPVANAATQGTGGDEQVLYVQGAGTYYIQMSMPDAGAYGGYEVYIDEQQAENVPCPTL